MNIPKEITKEILDEMIPVWEGLAENGWGGHNPDGLCNHFRSLCGIIRSDSFEFLKTYFFTNTDSYFYIEPRDGKEGAQKRVEILKQIRKHLCK